MIIQMPNELNQILADTNSPISEVISKVSSLDKTFNCIDRCSFGISANITLNGLSLELERQASVYGQKFDVIMGNYRDHTGNAEMFTAQGVRYAVFLWFFDAIIPSLGTRASILSDEEVSALCDSFTQELRLVLSKADEFERVFIPTMHKARFGSSMRSESAESHLVNIFNSIIETEANGVKNAVVLDTSNIISRLGADSCIDQRMYFLYKSPYKNNFLCELARDIFMEIRGDKSYFKKLLILDCDNTLWRGIIGEDGIEGIKLAPEDFPGNVFWEAQQFFLSLQKRGILIALCSKNDPESVDEVLTKHEFCVLKDEHIVAKKVNWKPKPDNIRELAKELDLGLDSFIFVDDSDFECEAVSSELPAVLVFQVPKQISEYPALLKKISAFFPTDKNAGNKTQEYKLRSLAKEESKNFSTHEEYLQSLQTRLTVRKDERDKISRIAELTQKTNQFNVTTKRYSEKDIYDLMNSSDSCVYSFHVSDKFGDSGLVGVCIVRKSGKIDAVDTFLMSCRVIGRGVEFAAWDVISREIKNADKIEAQYIPTQKNSLVQNFFDELGFRLTEQNEAGKRYEKHMTDRNESSEKYFLEVTYDG